MGFLPAKDMSGYGPAGRGAIIPEKNPATDSPKRIFVPSIYTLKIDNLSNLLRGMNIMGDDVGENGCFP